MIKTVTGHGILLSRLLGIPMPCGGRGVCGRCRVHLLEGEWLVEGQPVQAPKYALACRTILRSAWGKVECAEERQTIVHCESYGNALPSSPKNVIGIDLGTTTIAAASIRQGRICKYAGCLNPQTQNCRDIIGRIQMASTPEGLKTLRNQCIAGINAMLTELDGDKADTIAITAQSALSCILQGISPAPLGKYPFRLPNMDFSPVPTLKLGLHSNAQVLTMPPLTPYIGGDIAAGLGEITLDENEAFVDIGTNCEMVFRKDNSLLCTSAAAGPAFEGAGLACASQAIPGAIDHIRPDLSFSTIGNLPPVGICGSALIDLLAALRRNCLINQFGQLVQGNSFPITGELAISNEEISRLLTAKAAIFAGIQTLSEYAVMPLKKIYLAGAFAQYLDLGNAIAVGMLPEAEYVKLGNTSLAGALRLGITAKPPSLPVCQELQLNDMPKFAEHFAIAMKI